MVDLPLLLRRADQFKLVVFDMDNTLINETDYLFAAFDDVARLVAYGDVDLQSEISAWLKRTFAEEGRARLLDRMFEVFSLKTSSVSACLSVMRKVKVELKIFPWVESFCAVKSAAKFAVLTNGNPAQQRNKFDQMIPAGLRKLWCCYYAMEYAPKPHAEALLRVLREFDCSADQAIMIGDSDVDFECASAAGVAFFRVEPPVLRVG